MDGEGFDRLTRTLAAVATRRGFLSIAGVAAAGLGYNFAAARQRGPGTCGESGEVCTRLMGCCEGLTCATSAINTNYGICVTGSGDTTMVGATLISPFDEDAAEQVAAMVASASTTTTSTTVTDLRAQREAEIDARKATKKTQRQTKRDKQRVREDTQHDRRVSRRESVPTSTPTPSPTSTPRPTNTPVPTSTPRPTSTPQPTTAAPTPVPPPNVVVTVTCSEFDGVAQTVTVANNDAVDVILAKISSLLNLIVNEEPYLLNGLPVQSGTTRQIHFGIPDDPSLPGIWIAEARIFEPSAQEGVRVELESGDVFRACCEGTECLGQSAQIAADSLANPKSAERENNNDDERKKKNKKKTTNKGKNQKKDKNADNTNINNRDKNRNNNKSKATIERNG